MTQTPLKVDKVQFEEASGDILTIGRDATDGSLLFYDALNTSGIKLSELAGIRSISSVYVVGVSGAGAEYSVIQNAMDAVPVTSSSSDPALIWLGPGVYNEVLTWEKDGVIIYSPGGAVITNSAAATIDIKAAVGSTPMRAVLCNVKVVNTGVGNACVQVTGGVGSTVASERIDLINCDLEATGVGGRQINVSASNNILVQGGSWNTSVATASSLIDQCASFTLKDVVGVKGLQLDYDSGGAIPSLVGSTYTLSNITDTGNILSTLSGAGALSIQSCATVGDVTVNGDRTLKVLASEIGDLTLNNTTAATLIHSSRGTAVGTGTLAESIQRGSVSFAASASEVVTFTVPHPDAAYIVALEYEATTLAVTNSKGAAGFTVEFPAGPQTTAVNYAVLRDI